MRVIKRGMLLAVACCAAIAMATGVAVAEDQPEQGGTLVMGFTQTPSTLNGAIISGAASGLVTTKLFAGLVRFDDQWNPQPYLARSWEWSDDYKSLTLKLRDDAYFHDGEPITSADVAYSVMAVQANLPLKSLAAVTGVDTPDAHTAIIRLSHPAPSLLIALSPALCPILPKHVYDDGNDLKTNPHNSRNVVGSGPFELDKFVPGKEIVLKRFDQYFLKGKPYLDQIVVSYNNNGTALWLGMARGKIQMLPFPSTPTSLRLAEKEDGVRVLDRGYEATGALLSLEINVKREPLDDKRVRQAIAYSLDKNFIGNVLYAGYAKPAIGPIISASPLATATHEYPIDLDKARALLDEAGLQPDADGVRFETSINVMPGSEMDRTVAQYVRTQLGKVGVKVAIRQSPDYGSWGKRLATHDFDMTTIQLMNWGDPVIGVDRVYLSSNIRPVMWANNESYSNPEVDRLLEEAGSEPDLEKRKALYAEFQRIATEDLPIIQLVEVPYHTLVTDNVGTPPGQHLGAHVTDG